MTSTFPRSIALNRSHLRFRCFAMFTSAHQHRWARFAALSDSTFLSLRVTFSLFISEQCRHMQAAMLRFRHSLEILKTIVVLYFVDVVDDFVGSQQSTVMVFPQRSMFKHEAGAGRSGMIGAMDVDVPADVPTSLDWTDRWTAKLHVVMGDESPSSSWRWRKYFTTTACAVSGRLLRSVPMSVVVSHINRFTAATGAMFHRHIRPLYTRIAIGVSDSRWFSRS